MTISLHATISGTTWAGCYGELEINISLPRRKKLPQELSKILRDCGDFQEQSKFFTVSCFIQIMRFSKRKKGKVYLQNIYLRDLPSIAHLVR